MIDSELKKVSLLAIGVFAPAISVAATNMGGFNGFYAGLAGGMQVTNSSLSSYANAQVIDFFHNTSNYLANFENDVDLTSLNGIGAFTLGFGALLGDTKSYVGFEFYGSLQNSKNTLENQAYTLSQNGRATPLTLSTTTSMEIRDHEFGGDFRFGYQAGLTTLLYGRIGVAINTLKLDSHSFLNLNPNPLFVSYVANATDKNKPHLRLGVGFERKIAQHTSVTADYIHTYYGKLNVDAIAPTYTGEDGFEIINNGLNNVASGVFSTNTFMLGIKYYLFQ